MQKALRFLKLEKIIGFTYLEYISQQKKTNTNLYPVDVDIQAN